MYGLASQKNSSTAYNEVLLCGGLETVFGGLLYLLVLIAERFFICPQRRNNVYSTDSIQSLYWFIIVRIICRVIMNDN